MVTKDVKRIEEKFKDSKALLSNDLTEEEIIALRNYLANLDDSILTLKKGLLRIRKRKIFDNTNNYKRFISKISKYERKMLKKLVEDKEFHADYIGDILFKSSETLIRTYDDIPDYQGTRFRKNDFYCIFFDFMKTLKLETLFEQFIKDNKIYNLNARKSKNSFGSVAYNPLKNDVDIFVSNFEYNLSTMLTLAHEFGHVYDLINFDEGVSNYNKYFYQSFNGEVVSKLFERLFMNYMLEEGSLKEEVRDKLFEVEVINHDFLLGAYLLSILPDKYLINGSYASLSKKELIKIVNNEIEITDGIIEYVKNSVDFDVSDDFSYAYGDIFSMFLKERVLEEGFSKEIFNDFFDIRSKMFSRDYLEEHDMSKEKYLSLYKKEIRGLKK